MESASRSNTSGTRSAIACALIGCSIARAAPVSSRGASGRRALGPTRWSARGGPTAHGTLSVPVSAALRHSGVMIDGRSPRAATGSTGSTGRDLADAYRSELSKAPALARVFASGELTAVWACDASTYSSSTFGGHRFVLV